MSADEKARYRLDPDEARHMAGDGPTHGIASTYRSPKYACRCQPCRDANHVLQRIEDEKRKQRLAEDTSIVAHGLVSTYGNWGCRCSECSAAHQAQMVAARKSRYARLAADPSIVEHGRVATYTGWGCRCEPCREAVVKSRTRRVDQ